MRKQISIQVVMFLIADAAAITSIARTLWLFFYCGGYQP